MNEKRDITVGFKLSESEKERAELIAGKYGHKPGSLAAVLLRNFLNAYDTHGEALRYPPKFDYYEEQSVIDKKNERDGIEQAG